LKQLEIDVDNQVTDFVAEVQKPGILIEVVRYLNSRMKQRYVDEISQRLQEILGVDHIDMK
jgi:hypothetical protein